MKTNRSQGPQKPKMSCGMWAGCLPLIRFALASFHDHVPCMRDRLIYKILQHKIHHTMAVPEHSHTRKIHQSIIRPLTEFFCCTSHAACMAGFHARPHAPVQLAVSGVTTHGLLYQDNCFGFGTAEQGDALHTQPMRAATQWHVLMQRANIDLSAATMSP